MSVPIRNPNGYSSGSDSSCTSSEESCSSPLPEDTLMTGTQKLYRQPELSGPTDAASGMRRIFQWISQSNVYVSRKAALLIAKTVAIAAVAGIGAGSLGVPLKVFLPPVIIGGLCGYGAAAFRTQWDACHRIAAAVTLPVAVVTLGSSIGPTGVAALSVAAGSWGPEACMKVSRAVEKLFNWALNVRWPCERPS